MMQQNTRINRLDLIRQLIEKHNYTKKSAAAAVDDVINMIIENIENGNEVSIYGFGHFMTIAYKEHVGTNPRTLERYTVPVHYCPRFYPGNRMKHAVRKWQASKAGVKNSGTT